MFWNHRVMRRIENDASHLYIVEVYYEDGVEEGDYPGILGWTERQTPWADEEYDGIEGLRKTLTWMLDCLDKPILDEATLLAEAEANPLPREQWDGELLTFDELLESLGLEREDVEKDRWADDGGSYEIEEVSPAPHLWPDQD